MHIVLGELMRRWWRWNAQSHWPSLAPAATDLRECFSVAALAFQYDGNLSEPLTGSESTLEHASVYTEAELRQLIDIARERGHLRAEERR